MGSYPHERISRDNVMSLFENSDSLGEFWLKFDKYKVGSLSYKKFICFAMEATLLHGKKTTRVLV